MGLALPPHRPSGDQLLYSYLNLAGDPDSLVNRVVLDTAREIIEGRLAPGERIDSLSLAKRFDTSRTPIREALIALQRQGLIDIVANKRPRVSAPSDRQVVEIYELRAELHAIIARKVAAKATAEALDELEVRLGTMLAAAEEGDVDGYFWGNVEFHELSVRIADDSTLRRVVYDLGLQVLRLRHAGMAAPGQMQLSAVDHQRLVRANRDGDAALASTLSRSLVLRALAVLQAPSAS